MTQPDLFAKLQQYDTKPVPDQEPKLPDYMVYMKKTRGGHDIMVSTAEPPPPHFIAKAQEMNLPLFVPSEFMHLAGADDNTVQQVILAKKILVMPNSISTVIEPKDSDA